MKKFVATTMALAVLSSNVFAGNVKDKQTSFLDKCKNIEKFLPKAKVDKVQKAPIDNLCEIWTGPNVIYYAPDKQLIFFGEIWTKEGKSLTQESKNKLMAEKIKTLPLDIALTWGTGKVDVILFTDPDCPYCAKVEKFLFSPLFKDKIKVHVFLYPLPFHKNAREHSINILCSKEPIKQLLNYAEKKQESEKTSIIMDNKCKAEAEQKLAKMQEAAKQVGLRGTPLLFVDGKTVNGANMDMIANLINQALEKKQK